MSETLAQIQVLVARGEVRVSLRGYRELAADGILADEVLNGVGAAALIENYPDAVRGPTVMERKIP